MVKSNIAGFVPDGPNGAWVKLYEQSVAAVITGNSYYPGWEVRQEGKLLLDGSEFGLDAVAVCETAVQRVLHPEVAVLHWSREKDDELNLVVYRAQHLEWVFTLCFHPDRVVYTLCTDVENREVSYDTYRTLYAAMLAAEDVIADGEK